MKFIASALLGLAVLTACGRNQQTNAPPRQYQLSGKVVALNVKDRTATINAAAIPNFMEAMTMEYPVKSQSDFNSLRVGEKISATVEVRDDGSYDLSNVRAAASAK